MSAPEVGDICGGFEIISVTTLCVRYVRAHSGTVSWRMPIGQWWEWLEYCGRQPRCRRRGDRWQS